MKSMNSLLQISPWTWPPLLPSSGRRCCQKCPLRVLQGWGWRIAHSLPGSLPETSHTEAASQEAALERASQLTSVAGRSRKRLKSQEKHLKEHLPLHCPGGLQRRRRWDFYVLEAPSFVLALIAGVSLTASPSVFCNASVGKGCRPCVLWLAWFVSSDQVRHLLLWPDCPLMSQSCLNQICAMWNLS